MRGGASTRKQQSPKSEGCSARGQASDFRAKKSPLVSVWTFSLYPTPPVFSTAVSADLPILNFIVFAQCRFSLFELLTFLAAFFCISAKKAGPPPPFTAGAAAGAAGITGARYPEVAPPPPPPVGRVLAAGWFRRSGSSPSPAPSARASQAPPATSKIEKRLARWPCLNGAPQVAKTT